MRVGFDLDMTLIDARKPIAALIDEIAVDTGIPVSGAEMSASLGPPLQDRLAEAGFTPAEVDQVTARYWARYGEVLGGTLPMAGAAEAIASVHTTGGAVIVVTGKAPRWARAHVDEFGWPVDEVAGDLFAKQKALALKDFGAGAYVGDHVLDMVGAAEAGVLAVGVSTGPCSAAELRAAGAHEVLGSLTEFPDWLESVLGEPFVL